MIATHLLSKSYGTTAALTGITFDVAAGESLAVCGPTGSGRTTLLRLLGTLIRPSSGQIRIDGMAASERLHEVRQRVIYLGERPYGGEGLLAREYARFQLDASAAAAMKPLERAGIRGDLPVADMSVSLRRRLTLAVGLATRRKVLLLDEPFRDLETDARTAFIDWIREVRDAGASLVVGLEHEREGQAICHRTLQLGHTVTAPTDART